MKKSIFDTKLDKALDDSIAERIEMQKTKDRFQSLDIVKSKLYRCPDNSHTDIVLSWGRKAAFMHTSHLSTSSLPVDDETIKDFLNAEKED